MEENPYIKVLARHREQSSQHLSEWAEVSNLFNDVRNYARNESIPEFLSHYCSADTAIKIFENRTVWLTDVRKMNDESELIYAIKLLKSRLEKIEKNEPLYNDLSKKIRQDLDVLLRSPSGQQQDITNSVRDKIVMATCFSIHHDDANMWRIYGDNATGVEIQFNSDVLAKTVAYYHHSIPNANAYETGFVEVCYSGENCDCLQKLADQVIEAYKKTESNYERNIIRTLIAYYISDFVMSHKNPAFKGEGEYRIFTHIPINKTWSGSNFLLNHPNGKTQYTELCLGAWMIGYRSINEFLPDLIQSINFGPHINKDKKDKLEEILVSLGLKEIFKISTIPLRP